MTLTLKKLQKLLTTRFGGVLKSGKHDQDGEACVRELRSCALKLPWSDAPDGGSATDRACQPLNDGPWSSNEVRTEHCLQLALLTESDASQGWIDEYVDRIIREILPLALEAAARVNTVKKNATAMNRAAALCAAEGTVVAAKNAAKIATAAFFAAAESAWKDRNISNVSAAARAAATASTAAAAAARAAEATEAAVGASTAAARAAEATEAAAMASKAAARAAEAIEAAARASKASRPSRAADDVLARAVKILVECGAGGRYAR